MNRKQRTLLTLLALATPASAQAAPTLKASGEALVHNEGVNGDIKARVILDDITFKPWYFLRDKPVLDYDGKVLKRLTVNEVMVAPGYDLRLGGQMRFIGGEAFAVAASERYNQFNDMFALYTALRFIFGDQTTGELHLTPKVKIDDISLATETVTQATRGQFLGTKVSGRVGYQVLDGLVVGVGVDTAFGTGKPWDYQAGVFVLVGK